MSETLSPSRAFAPPLFRPQMMIGAVTPLWGYFTGAAMTGVAMWWISRWMPAQKPRGLMVAAPEPAIEPPIEAAAKAAAVALEAPPVVAKSAPALVAVEPVALEPEPAADVKLLAAPAAPRSRKAKDAEPKPD